MRKNTTLFKSLYGVKAMCRDFWFFGWHRQLWYFLRFRNTEVKLKFVLLYCQGRTGSTFLSSALDQQAECLYEEEVMRRKIWHWQSFFTGLAQRNTETWYVLKVKPMHLVKQGLVLSDLMQWAQQHSVVLIHLSRKDLFAHALSKIIAAQRNEYVRKVEGQKVYVQRQYLIDKIKELEAFAESECRASLGFSPIRLVYEEDIEPKEAKPKTIARLYGALGISGQYQAPDVYKVLSKELKNEVLNWEELEDLQE